MAPRGQDLAWVPDGTLADGANFAVVPEGGTAYTLASGAAAPADLGGLQAATVVAR